MVHKRYFTSVNFKTIMEEEDIRHLYDGSLYHVCTNGLEQITLLKDEEDYKTAWNYLALSAWRIGVQIVVFTIMSNHIHEIIACRDASQADKTIKLFKKMLSLYLQYAQESAWSRKNTDGLVMPATFPPAETIMRYLQHHWLFHRKERCWRLAWTWADARFKSAKTAWSRLIHLSDTTLWNALTDIPANLFCIISDAATMPRWNMNWPASRWCV